MGTSADDRDGCRLHQLADILTDEGDPEDHLALLVDDHARLALIAVGLQARAGDPTQVVVHDPGLVSGILCGLRGEADRRDLGLAEGHLGHGLVVRRRHVGAPGRVIHVVAERPGDDDVADGTGLVLALVGQQRAVVDVTGRIQPVAARDLHRVIHFDPVAGSEANDLKADIG